MGVPRSIAVLATCIVWTSAQGASLSLVDAVARVRQRAEARVATAPRWANPGYGEIPAVCACLCPNGDSGLDHGSLLAIESNSGSAGRSATP